jgi:molybdopterin synthase catalytic subunit
MVGDPQQAGGGAAPMDAEPDPPEDAGPSGGAEDDGGGADGGAPPPRPAGAMLQGPEDAWWFAEVTPGRLEAARFTELVPDAAAGAVAMFIGTTRDSFQGARVLRLEYEAYTPMALAKLKARRHCPPRRHCAPVIAPPCPVAHVPLRFLSTSDAAVLRAPRAAPRRARRREPRSLRGPGGRPDPKAAPALRAETPPGPPRPAPPPPSTQELCLQVRQRWGVTRVAVAHRVGVVEVCEASVVIAVSSPHRRAALEVRVVDRRRPGL